MKRILWKTIISSLFLIPYSFAHAAVAPNANIKYVVARDGSPVEDQDKAEIEEIERLKHLYIYGGYGFYFANDVPGAPAENGWGNLNAGIGARFADGFRMELAYERLAAEYNLERDVKTDGYFGFINAIFDAKLPPTYRFFKTSPFVPFAGFGFGAGAIDPGRGARLKNDAALAYNFIGGVSIELNRTIALAVTYKYVKMLPNKLEYDYTYKFTNTRQVPDPADPDPENPTLPLVDEDFEDTAAAGAEIKGFAPSGHIVSIGFRMNF